MVAPGFLKNPTVLRWPSGIEPAPTMLEFDRYCALRAKPSARNRTIRLEPGLTYESEVKFGIASRIIVTR
jgi:hypothetical protein